jgi:hypothetical protein
VLFRFQIEMRLQLPIQILLAFASPEHVKVDDLPSIEVSKIAVSHQPSAVSKRRVGPGAPSLGMMGVIWVAGRGSGS